MNEREKREWTNRNERKKWGITMIRMTFSSIQWMVFMIASSIVTPIAVAASYGMDPIETAGLIQRTLFILGVSSILQIFFGHRLPINEGPAGLWWGVFVIYASLGPTLFGSSHETLQIIEGGMIVSGCLFILLSLFGWIERISTLFSPVVTGVYLLLLVSQLSGSFLNGMLGVGYRGEDVDLPITMISIFLVVLTFLFIRKGTKMMKQYAILISLLIGWLLFGLFDLAVPIEKADELISLPTLFSFGFPTFDLGMGLTASFITFLLLVNLIASVQVVNQVMERFHQKRMTRFREAGLVTGVNQLLAGVFSAIGCVPISGAAGFIATTTIYTRLPFMIGSALVIVISLFPQVTAFFAALPSPVGYAAIFIIFANMIGIAFEEFDKAKDKKQVRYVVGIAMLTGIGAMFVSANAFQNIPPVVTAIFNNGLVLGTIVAMIVDQLTKRST